MPSSSGPPETSSARSPLLRIRDLSVSFRTGAGVVRAVDHLSYDIFPGETLAVVGESGSGKSVSAMSILGLTETQGGTVDGGEIWFEGRNLREAPERQLRQLRGNRIAMVFQEPMSSLNPVFTIGDQIGESLRMHRGLSASAATRRAVDLLSLVGIPSPEARVREYPHQLSGGMRQRAVIAMALSCRPRLLIADEPTTALDVTVQAQILELLRDLQEELGMSILLITHDLGVVAEVAHRAVVMYAGRVVEQASVLDLFDRPRHPYTAGLFQSLPSLGSQGHERLRPIPGNVPDALRLPSGCRFHPRCRFRVDRCSDVAPALRETLGEHGDHPRHHACHYTDLHPRADLLREEAGAGR